MNRRDFMKAVTAAGAALQLRFLREPSLRAALKPPEKLSVAEWAESYRVLPSKNQALGGQWQHRAAYLVEIMESISERRVQFVSIMKSPQTGGSEAMLNALGWSMTTSPGPTAYVMPTEDAKKEFVRDRIRPMLQLSTHPLFQRWVNPKLWEKSRIDMPDMTLFALHAGSATDLASRPIQYVYLDEVDKYKDISREGHPEDLAIKRTITFQQRKTVVRVSTPTVETGRIYLAWKAGDQRRWHVPCSKCGTWQVLSRSSIRWPQGSSAAQVMRDKSAWVECVSCGAKYDDKGRDEIVNRGKWVPDECSIDDDGTLVGEQGSEHRSYHIWAGMSPWVSIHEIASQDIASMGDPMLRHDFTNNVLGEPFFELDTDLEVSDLTASAEVSTFKRGVAPEWAELVIVGADVQKGPRIPWLAVACGQNEQYAILDWGELVGVESFDQYEAMFRGQQWPTETGALLDVRLALIDHEGGLHTSIVEDLGARNQDVLRLVSGRDKARSPIVLGQVDRFGRRGSEFRGLPLYTLDTNYHKDRVARMLATPPGTRGSIQLPMDPTSDLLKQLSSEAKIIPRTGKNRAPVWAPKPGVRVNDLWDCLVYAMSGSYMLGLHANVLEHQEARRQEERAKGSRDFGGDEKAGDSYFKRARERSQRGSYFGRRR